MLVVTRARLLVLGTALVLTGCGALIGVNDIFLDEGASENEGGEVGETGGPDQVVVGPGADGGEAGTCNADAMADPDNCGRCGRGCLGGTCASGVCQVVTVLNGAASPRDFALDDQFAYVTNIGDSTIKKVPKDGGASTNIVSNWNSVDGIAVADKKLFWTAEDSPGNGTIPTGGSYGGLWSCTLPACTDKKLIQPITYGYRLFANNGVIYSASDDGVGRVHTDGGAPAILNSDRIPKSVAADSTHVYYLSVNGPSRALLDGGAPEDLAQSVNNFTGLLAIDDAGVYWTSWEDTNDAGSTVAGSMKSGAGLITFSSKNVRPYGIASDGTNLYWTNQGGYDQGSDPLGDGQVLSCPVAGCGKSPPTVVADKLRAPTVVQVDGDAIYFIEFGGVPGAKGRLLKVAKP